MGLGDGQLGQAFKAQGAAGEDWAALTKRSRARAASMFAHLSPKHQQVVTDPGPWLSLIGTRRSGKTYLMSSMALMTGEAKPGSIMLIGSLTLKALRRNFWFGAPSGIVTLARENGLNIKTNSSELRWEHENGSVGYLLGAESREALEYWRGIEADLYLIDECKSFAPSVLEELVDDIISPQRLSRRGRVLLGGTPGSIFAGPFWQSTYEGAAPVTETGDSLAPYCVPFGQEDSWGRKKSQYWSFHRLTMQDNIAKPHQWEDALDFKSRKAWADDHPTWRREYLGEWINSAEGLVYRYLAEKPTGRVNWVPERTVENPTGLPAEQGPWHLVFGLDLGFEDPTALVIAAWSETVREVRHVHDESHQHLTPEQVLGLLSEAAGKYGMPEMVIADAAGLGKMIITWFEERGVPIVKADKNDKFDHIELINSEFASGSIKIIQGTVLENQLCSVQWDLSDGAKAELAKKGKLREDRACPNDVTDAFLYLLRYCYHGFSVPAEKAPDLGSDDWVKDMETKAFKAAAAEVRHEAEQTALEQPWRDEFAPGVARIIKSHRWLPWH